MNGEADTTAVSVFRRQENRADVGHQTGQIIKSAIVFSYS